MVKIKFANNALSEQQVGSVHTHAHIYIHIHTRTKATTQWSSPERMGGWEVERFDLDRGPAEFQVLRMYDDQDTGP